MAESLRFRDHLSSEQRQALALTDDHWARLEALFAGQGGLAAALTHRAALGSPPVPALLQAAIAYREFRRCRAAAARATAVPPSWLARARHPAEIATLQRAVARLGANGPLAELLEVRSAALALAMRDGELRAELAPPPDDAPADAPPSPWAEQVGGARPEELGGHRWLAWRRGEREGGLRLRCILPEAAIREQVGLRPALAAALAASPQALEELLLTPLPAAVRQRLDEQAAETAGRAAALAYEGLLTTPGVQAERLAAGFVGAPRQPIGLVRVDGQGRRQETKRVAVHPGWADEVRSWLAAGPLEGLVLPTGAPDHARLDRLRQLAAEAGVRVLPVRPAALAEARAALPPDDGGLPAELASALVLARRALDPWAALSPLDPAALGLAEYQQELDEAALRARLDDVRTWLRWRREGERSGPPRGPSAERRVDEEPEGEDAPRGRSPAPAAARPPVPPGLNPLVKTVEDLRPGMQVAVVVTNLTPFGAFVSLGLPQEGLIHVSELADRFIEDPTEVVRIGQELRARVLDIDRGRNRISLSLRSAPSSADRGDERSVRGERDDQLLLRRSGSGGKGKALADLEKLFRR